MKYYIIAGEASGDLHGSNLIRAIRKLDPTAEIRGWGGDLMEAAGMTLVKHYRDLAFMGFVEVVKNLGTILGNLKFCKRDILHFRPDRLILIDYPGFNLRIAKWFAKKRYETRPPKVAAQLDITAGGSSVAKCESVYYISPQVWAWHTSRTKQLRDYVDKLLVILPFEKDFFAKHGVEAEFVGHPLLDVIADESVSEREPNLIALLPGSRTQEIRTSLPIMLEAAARFPDYRFVIAGAPSQSEDLYRNLLTSVSPNLRVDLTMGDTYGLLCRAHAALVTSGTATLETALFNVPEVVCYRGNPISAAIARRLIGSRIKYISLVNLVMDRLVVPELIQDDFNAERVARELKKIVAGPGRERQLRDLRELRGVLGAGGASERAAAAILENRDQRVDQTGEVE